MCEGGAGDAAADEGGGGDGGSTKPVLVLGAGWVGSRLARALLEHGHSVVVTNRPGTNVQAKPPYFRPVPLELPSTSAVSFNLDDPETWGSLPAPEDISAAVVTFPLSPGPEALWESYLQHVPNVVCYSSTSVYQVDAPGQRVDESTPIKETGRALAEQYVLERGATVLTISGIFGERRAHRPRPYLRSTCDHSWAARFLHSRGPRQALLPPAAPLASSSVPMTRSATHLVHPTLIPPALPLVLGVPPASGRIRCPSQHALHTAISLHAHAPSSPCACRLAARHLHLPVHVHVSRRCPKRQQARQHGARGRHHRGVAPLPGDAAAKGALQCRRAPLPPLAADLALQAPVDPRWARHRPLE